MKIVVISAEYVFFDVQIHKQADAALSKYKQQMRRFIYS